MDSKNRSVLNGIILPALALVRNWLLFSGAASCIKGCFLILPHRHIEPVIPAHGFVADGLVTEMKSKAVPAWVFIFQQLVYIQEHLHGAKQKQYAYQARHN